MRRTLQRGSSPPGAPGSCSPTTMRAMLRALSFQPFDAAAILTLDGVGEMEHSHHRRG